MIDNQCLKLILVDETIHIINFYDIEFYDNLIRIYSNNGVYTFVNHNIKSIFMDYKKTKF